MLFVVVQQKVSVHFIREFEWRSPDVKRCDNPHRSTQFQLRTLYCCTANVALLQPMFPAEEVFAERPETSLKLRQKCGRSQPVNVYTLLVLALHKPYHRDSPGLEEFIKAVMGKRSGASLW